jgi:hypothetical protein
MQDRRHQVTAATSPRHPERLDPPSLISARQAQPVRLGSVQAHWQLQDWHQRIAVIALLYVIHV